MKVKHQGRKWGESVNLAFEANTTTTAHTVKQEAVELHQHYISEDEEEDQMTLSQYFSSPPNFTHTPIPSPMVKSEMPLETKKRPWVSKFPTKRVVRGNPRKSERQKKARVIKDELCDHIEVDSVVVMERAVEIQANLPPQFPSFVKLMLRSHVTKGFWLGLPSEFCKLHLPKHDETISLEGENGEEYKTKFLADKVGLSGGWRGFSIAHKLQEGDVVVFQLVRFCKFKVYVVRANNLAGVDGALGLLNLGPCAKENDFEACKENEIRRRNENQPRPGSPTVRTPTDQSEHVSSEATDDFGSSSSFDFKNFDIIVNGLSIDFELSKHVRGKYYELCCTQKSYLHRHLSQKINSTLAAGIIAETVNIADAIQECKLSTSRDDFAIWVKTLEAFELLGMDVGFLRARLSQLVSLAFESKVAAASRRYMEAHLERERAEEELRTLELKILELKQTKIRVNDGIEALSGRQQRYELKFQEEASAPW